MHAAGCTLAPRVSTAVESARAYVFDALKISIRIHPRYATLPALCGRHARRNTVFCIVGARCELNYSWDAPRSRILAASAIAEIGDGCASDKRQIAREHSPVLRAKLKVRSNYLRFRNGRAAVEIIGDAISRTTD